MEVTARVVWSREFSGDIREVGCAFLDMADEQAGRVRLYVERSHEQARKKTRFSRVDPHGKPMLEL